MENRRTQVRKLLRTRVAVAASGLVPMQASSFDISIGGLGIVTQVALAQGSACRVGFTLFFNDRTSMTFDTMATVAYCLLSNEQHGGFKVGARFVKLAPAAEAALQRYLDS